MNRQTSAAGLLNGASKAYGSQVSFNPQGGVQQITYGNNVVPVYTYDRRLRPANFTSTIGNNANQYLQALGYAWNANSTLQSHSIRSGAAVPYSSLSLVSQSFTYDNVNRVTSIQDNGGGATNQRNFGYDQWGDMWASNSSGTFPWNGSTPSAAIQTVRIGIGASGFGNILHVVYGIGGEFQQGCYLGHKCTYGGVYAAGTFAASPWTFSIPVLYPGAVVGGRRISCHELPNCRNLRRCARVEVVIAEGIRQPAPARTRSGVQLSITWIGDGLSGSAFTY